MFDLLYGDVGTFTYVGSACFRVDSNALFLTYLGRPFVNEAKRTPSSLVNSWQFDFFPLAEKKRYNVTKPSRHCRRVYSHVFIVT